MNANRNALDSYELSEGAKQNTTAKNDTTPQPEITAQELRAMHRWCLKYRDLVRSGGKPSPEQDRRFMLFAPVCYATGAVDGN